MTTLEILLVLKSNQGGVPSQLYHEIMVEVEKLYIGMPKGFEQYLKTGRKKCLKLK